MMPKQNILVSIGNKEYPTYASLEVGILNCSDGSHELYIKVPQAKGETGEQESLTALREIADTITGLNLAQHNQERGFGSERALDCIRIKLMDSNRF